MRNLFKKYVGLIHIEENWNPPVASKLAAVESNQTLMCIHARSDGTAYENIFRSLRVYITEREMLRLSLGKLQYRGATSRCYWHTRALNSGSRYNNRRSIFIMANTSATFYYASKNHVFILLMKKIMSESNFVVWFQCPNLKINKKYWQHCNYDNYKSY